MNQDLNKLPWKTVEGPRQTSTRVLDSGWTLELHFFMGAFELTVISSGGGQIGHSTIYTDDFDHAKRVATSFADALFDAPPMTRKKMTER